MNCSRSEQQIQNNSEAQEVSPTTHLCTAHHSAPVAMEMTVKSEPISYMHATRVNDKRKMKALSYLLQQQSSHSHFEITLK